MSLKISLTYYCIYVLSYSVDLVGEIFFWRFSAGILGKGEIEYFWKAKLGKIIKNYVVYFVRYLTNRLWLYFLATKKWQFFTDRTLFQKITFSNLKWLLVVNLWQLTPRKIKRSENVLPGQNWQYYIFGENLFFFRFSDFRFAISSQYCLNFWALLI